MGPDLELLIILISFSVDVESRRMGRFLDLENRSNGMTIDFEDENRSSGGVSLTKLIELSEVLEFSRGIFTTGSGLFSGLLMLRSKYPALYSRKAEISVMKLRSARPLISFDFMI